MALLHRHFPSQVLGIWPLLALLLSCRGGELLTARADEGTDYVSPYAAWSHGPPTDPGYFPIGVWLQDPRHAEAYRAIGINAYVGLWQGPTEAQLARLGAAGLRVICRQNEVGLAHLDDPTIIAWMHVDEPDNAQRQADGSWGGPVPVAQIEATYQRLRANDPTRPVWLNLGQGVANDEWVGRAAAYDDYPAYVAACDIVSFDVYPVAGIRRGDGENYLWYVARGVERLRAWSADAKPVWSIIETTRIHGARGPTPAQVEAEVWMALIHGARGIVYFAHEWNPVFRAARLLEDEEMRGAVAAINAQIAALAPVLNRPELAGWGEVTAAAEEIPIAVAARRHLDDLYLFAVPMRPGATSARFALAERAHEGVVEVLGEERRLRSAAGRFADEFATYQVHRYRIAGYFAP